MGEKQQSQNTAKIGLKERPGGAKDPNRHLLLHTDPCVFGAKISDRFADLDDHPYHRNDDEDVTDHARRPRVFRGASHDVSHQIFQPRHRKMKAASADEHGSKERLVEDTPNFGKHKKLSAKPPEERVLTLKNLMTVVSLSNTELDRKQSFLITLHGF